MLTILRPPGDQGSKGKEMGPPSSVVSSAKKAEVESITSESPETEDKARNFLEGFLGKRKNAEALYSLRALCHIYNSDKIPKESLKEDRLIVEWVERLRENVRGCRDVALSLEDCKSEVEIRQKA